MWSIFAYAYVPLWRRQWHPTPVLLPGKSQGRRSLVGCSPWGHEESDMTERLPFYFSLSCIGEGNGNPPQCSCLENPRDGGAWWAAIYAVAQSRIRLKQLSSSSSMYRLCIFPGSCLGPIFKIGLFCYCWALIIICIFWITFLYQNSICYLLQIFTPYVDFLILLTLSLCKQALNFNEIQLINPGYLLVWL